MKYTILAGVLIFITLFNFNVITESISLSFTVCINNLLPSLIPFLLLSNILIQKGLFLDNPLSLTLLCFISGSPNNSKLIKNYLDNSSISINDSQKLLNYLQYINPIYVLNGIGLIALQNKKFGLIILISNLVSSLILGRFNKVTIKKFKISDKNIFNIITDSIKDTINTVLYIIGVITFFFMLTSFIDINSKYKFIYGIFEITQGIHYLSVSHLTLYFKVVLATFFISFGGLSMHMQIFGILDNKKISYKTYFINRIIHSILSVTIVSILFCILN